MGAARDTLVKVAQGMVVRRVLPALLGLSAAGSAGIIAHEGMVRRVYLDPVGIPTACAGHTATVTLADVGRPVSEAVCTRMLLEDSRSAQEAVKRLVRVPVTQEQFDALVSFTFNVGGAALGSSTLLRLLNSGQCHAAADQFSRWVYATRNGQRVKLPGLVKRRADEAALFRSGCE